MLPQLNVFGLLISTYFLIISFDSLFCSLWFIKRAEKRGLRRVAAIDITLLTLLGGFLGARLLHVFYEEPDFYFAHPSAALEVWNGGFVYLGGLLGALGTVVFYCLRVKEPFWFWADVAAAPLALGYAVGRIACFFNGCCYGRYCQLPWAVNMAGGLRHPTQAYAALWELMVLALLLKFEKRVSDISGLVFNAWLFMHCLGRIVMEIFRDDPRGPLILSMSLGVWMSFTIGVVAAYNLVSTLHKHRYSRTS